MILIERLGPDNFSTLQMNGHVLHRAPVHLKVPGCSVVWKALDEFSVKQDVEKFLRRVQPKAFFHDKEDDSNTSDKDIFETLQTRKSKWTSPEDQFASLDFFINKCRHGINN